MGTFTSAQNNSKTMDLPLSQYDVIIHEYMLNCFDPVDILRGQEWPVNDARVDR